MRVSNSRLLKKFLESYNTFDEDYREFSKDKQSLIAGNRFYIDTVPCIRIDKERDVVFTFPLFWYSSYNRHNLVRPPKLFIRLNPLIYPGVKLWKRDHSLHEPPEANYRVVWTDQPLSEDPGVHRKFLVLHHNRWQELRGRIRIPMNLDHVNLVINSCSDMIHFMN